MEVGMVGTGSVAAGGGGWTIGSTEAGGAEDSMREGLGSGEGSPEAETSG